LRVRTPRDVVLVPGLWMPGIVMGLLAARLARADYTPHLFAYSGRGPLEANVERLARYASDCCAGRPASFVGHSLGGLLVLETLNRRQDIRLASAVLLAAPVRGCLAGRRLARAHAGRWMLGASVPLWTEKREARWQRSEPLGVVAGTRPIGLGRAFGPLPGPNDGVVRVDETTLEGMSERALVPLGHSAIIASSRVARLVGAFLAGGSFPRADAA
jgi:pimeloyl-ACP methyl ester carboxylesterase